jgi:hypothetical protein
MAASLHCNLLRTHPCICNLCSGSLTLCQLLDLISAIRLQILDKKCAPHIGVPLQDVRHELLTLACIKINSQHCGKSFHCSFISEDTDFDLGYNVPVNVRQHHFQREICQENTLNEANEFKVGT